MTTMSTTRRTFCHIAIAAAVSFSLAYSTGARGVESGQEDQGKSKTMKKTASGLQYHDEKVGTGETPKTGQTCIMHYTGWLWEKNAKGAKFDSSKDRNEPFSFDIGKGEVIKGWDEGVATMKVGGKRASAHSSRSRLRCPRRRDRYPSQRHLALRSRVAGISTMKKTESGLEYRDIKEGTGESPKKGQTCVVHYTGWIWETVPRVRNLTARWIAANPFHSPSVPEK